MATRVDPRIVRRGDTYNTHLFQGYGRGCQPAASVTITSAFPCVPCGLIGFSLFFPAVGAHPLRWQPVE